MECIESIGQPTSTVRTPSLDSPGPTVDPHALGIGKYVRLLECRPPQGGVYAHIVADLVILHLPPLALDELLDEECADRVGRVALLRIRLDHDATVDARRVVVLVTPGVVRVECVRHVRTDEERACNALRECTGRGREPVEQ